MYLCSLHLVYVILQKNFIGMTLIDYYNSYKSIVFLVAAATELLRDISIVLKQKSNKKMHKYNRILCSWLEKVSTYLSIKKKKYDFACVEKVKKLLIYPNVTIMLIYRIYPTLRAAGILLYVEKIIITGSIL